PSANLQSGFGADRDDALFVALALHSQIAGIEMQAVERKIADFADTGARRVQRVQKRAVAHDQRAFAARGGKQRLNLRNVEIVRQRMNHPWRQKVLGWVARVLDLRARKAEEHADGADAAGNSTVRALLIALPSQK